MSGLPWFELDVDFLENPKVRALATRLREPLADAYVSRVYVYCYRHTIDRFDPVVAVETIEEAAGWRKRRGVLFDALMAVGVLEREAGRVVVHGVHDRLGPHLAKRRADRIRIADKRDKAATSIQSGQVVAATSRRRRADVAGNKDRDIDRDVEARSSTVTDPRDRTPEEVFHKLFTQHPAWTPVRRCLTTEEAHRLDAEALRFCTSVVAGSESPDRDRVTAIIQAHAAKKAEA